MELTEEQIREIKKWTKDNVDSHGWVTQKMLFLYAQLNKEQ